MAHRNENEQITNDLVRLQRTLVPHLPLKSTKQSKSASDLFTMYRSKNHRKLIRTHSITYIGNHHPHGVKYNHGHFTWSMNARKYGPIKHNQTPELIGLTRNKSSEIPGYKQYLQYGTHGLPFACWLMLCCGLCIPCCCYCCEDNNNTNDSPRNVSELENNKTKHGDTKPLIQKPQNTVNKLPKPDPEPISYQSIW
eukprot:92587_1